MDHCPPAWVTGSRQRLYRVSAPIRMIPENILSICRAIEFPFVGPLLYSPVFKQLSDTFAGAKKNSAPAQPLHL